MIEIVWFVLQLGLFVYIGFSAFDWQRSGLKRKGYSLYAVVSGKNLADAELRFFDKMVDVDTVVPLRKRDLVREEVDVEVVLESD